MNICVYICIGVCICLSVTTRHELLIYLYIWNKINIVMCCHSDNCTKNSKNHFLLSVLWFLAKSSLIHLHEIYYVPCIYNSFPFLLNFLFHSPCEIYTKVKLVLFQPNEISVHTVVTLNAFHIHLFSKRWKYHLDVL